MQINQLNREKINNILHLYSLFESYQRLENVNIPKSSSKISSVVDFNFISKIYDRWVFIRIKEFENQIEISIWLNKNLNRAPTNFDFKFYFIKNLKLPQIRHLMNFKIQNIDEFYPKFNGLIKFIDGNADLNLKNLINGNIWIDVEFDWGPYK